MNGAHIFFDAPERDAPPTGGTGGGITWKSTTVSVAKAAAAAAAAAAVDGGAAPSPPPPPHLPQGSCALDAKGGITDHRPEQEVRFPSFRLPAPPDAEAQRQAYERAGGRGKPTRRWSQPVDDVPRGGGVDEIVDLRGTLRIVLRGMAAAPTLATPPIMEGEGGAPRRASQRQPSFSKGCHGVAGGGQRALSMRSECVGAGVRARQRSHPCPAPTPCNAAGRVGKHITAPHCVL